MPDRIASRSSNNELVNILLGTQRRMQESQVQVSTLKRSQTYSGIAQESERLVNVETTRAALDRFVAQNTIADVRLKTQDTVIVGMEKTIASFRESLLNFEEGGQDVQTRVATIQDAAFRTLKDLEIFLNTDVDGRFLFSGGRISTTPVDLELTKLIAFQAEYNGDSVVYPVTRDAHLANFVTANANTGDLTFDSAADTITATTAGSLANIPVGTVITVAGSAGNNGSYTVVTNDGTTISVAGTIAATTVIASGDIVADETIAATLSASTYYDGDSVVQSHRVANDRTIDIDVTAINPAFEKAIRAMSIIAQGAFGTAGGLDQNSQRIDEALFLVNSSLDSAVPGTPPYGNETIGNFDQVETDLAFKRVLIDQTVKNQKNLINFFESRTTDIEDVNQLDAVTRLLADQRVLEASFEALARISNLSLINFIK